MNTEKQAQQHWSRKRRNAMCSARGIFTVILFLSSSLGIFEEAGAREGTSLPDKKGLPQIGHLVTNGGILMGKNGKELFAHNPDTLFIPASILKIATSLAALDILGAGYRFETTFFLTKNHDLIIKGYGDPALTSEEIDAIAAELVKRGLSRVRDIGIDGTAFALDTKAPGTGSSLNPYEAANGALAVNYNTVHILVGNDGDVRSAEEQTPTMPIMKRLGRNLPAGKHRIDISDTPDNVMVHSGELFAALLGWRGVMMEGGIKALAAPDGLAPFYVHSSRQDLTEVVRGMLRFSSNFTANQLFLACGAKTQGNPASWEKGRETLTEYLQKKCSLTIGSFHIDEGSGISRRNRITPRAMLELLDRFQPHAYLMPEEHGTLLKSGTLSGVYCYAGYLHPEAESIIPFVIMLNQKENARDRVLNLLLSKTEFRSRIGAKLTSQEQP